MRCFAPDRQMTRRRHYTRTGDETDGKNRHHDPKQLIGGHAPRAFLRVWVSASGWLSGAGELPEKARWKDYDQIRSSAAARHRLFSDPDRMGENRCRTY